MSKPQTEEPKPKTAYENSLLDSKDTFAQRNVKRLNGVTKTAEDDYRRDFD